MRTTRHRLAVLLLPLALAVTPAGAAIFKWVDEQGNTHYGSAIPPEYAKQGTRQEKLNEQGQTVRVIQEKEKTPEQKAEAERLRLAEEEREKLEEEKQLHDRLLLNTYDSVDGLVLARDGKIRSLEGQITVAAGQVRERKALLDRQRETAADRERSGRSIGDKLKADMATTEDQIARNSARIAALRADQARIQQTYDRDIARYLELKGLAPAEAKGN